MSERLPEGTRVKSTSDGQIGYVVKTSSGLAIRLDRKANTIVPYDLHRWVEMDEVSVTNMQMARVAYDADRALRQVQGEYKVPEWICLGESAKIDFMNKGPAIEEDGHGEARLRLFVAVIKALRDK